MIQFFLHTCRTNFGKQLFHLVQDQQYGLLVMLLQVAPGCQAVFFCRKARLR